MLSRLLMVVVKTPISSVTPRVPATSTRSPTLNGRKISSITPAEKLDNVPWRARPIARPAAPSTATAEAVGMPKMPRTATPTKASTM